MLFSRWPLSDAGAPFILLCFNIIFTLLIFWQPWTQEQGPISLIFASGWVSRRLPTILFQCSGNSLCFSGNSKRGLSVCRLQSAFLLFWCCDEKSMYANLSTSLDWKSMLPTARLISSSSAKWYLSGDLTLVGWYNTCLWGQKNGASGHNHLLQQRQSGETIFPTVHTIEQRWGPRLLNYLPANSFFHFWYADENNPVARKS